MARGSLFASIALLAGCADADVPFLGDEPLPEAWMVEADGDGMDDANDAGDLVDSDADGSDADVAARALPAGLNFRQGALVPGTDVPFTVTGAAPGDLVRFVYSTVGTGAGPCFAGLGGLCLDVLAPVHQFGTDNADGLGTAELLVHIPNNAPQIFLFTQAVVDRGNGSVKTNTITSPVLSGALDDDQDGYCDGNTCADPNALPGDCDDTQPDVFPGQTAYFDVPYPVSAGWSFDYDCDGITVQEVSDAYRCNGNGGGLACPHQDGWNYGVPSCGQTGTLATGCIEFPIFGICTPGYSVYATQRCR